jgi:hypothetical protein
MPSLIGNKPNQVSTNGDLGRLAFMDNLDSFTSKTVMDTDITNIAPSLNLDFANSKVLDPRITFTRASTATFYNGISSAVAEQNLLTWSQDVDQAVWSKNNTTITANSTTAPDGTSTADTQTATGTSGVYYAQSLPLPATGQSVTVSRYVKAGTKAFCTLGLQGLADAFFDLTGLTTSFSGSGAVSASITDVGNSWRRVTATWTWSGATCANYCAMASSLSSSAGITVGDTIFVWGHQAEQRSAVTAYTPTTTAAVTNYIPTLSTAAAGVARFDHNPITGESLGLLIEEQRVNLSTYSDDFSNAAWNFSENSSITANTIIAPDGTLTADGLIENTSTGVHRRGRQNISITSGQVYTISVYAKSSNRNLMINAVNNFGARANFNLSNGTINSTSNGTSSILNAGNGWYRCSVTGTAPTTTASGTFLFQINTNTLSDDNSYTGDGWSGIYIWGAQVEAGAFATSYIPTVASQVTRSPDAASMTGTNFSSWYNNAEGTLYAESASPLSGSSGFSRAFIISDNSVSNFISAGTATSQVRTAGVFQADLGTTQVANTFYKVAVGVKTNDVAVSYNGAAVQTDTSVVLPRVNQAQIGGLETNLGNGVIRKVAYYPRRLSNEELREMTA